MPVKSASSCPPKFVLGNEPMKRLLGVIPVRDEAAATRATTRALGDLGIPSCPNSCARLGEPPAASGKRWRSRVPLEAGHLS